MTRKRKTKELETSQLSASYIPPEAIRQDPRLSSRSFETPKLYLHMFLEDIHLKILPYDRSQDENPVRMAVSPKSKETEDLIAYAISDRHYVRDFPDAVREFFQSCAYLQVAHGECIYEIVYLTEPESKRAVKFELRRIAPATIRPHFGKWIQYIPPVVAKERGLPTQIEIPEDRVLAFAPPVRYQQRLRGMLGDLASLSEQTLPKFVLEQSPAAAQTAFEVEEHIRANRRAIASVTEAIGWNARGLFEKQALEYYQIYRELKFQEFKVDIRESILETLNAGLARIGMIVGFQAAVQLGGLPTKEEIQKARQALLAGPSTMGEIWKPFLKY